MKRRTVLTGVLVWVLVVAAVSGVTWAVIDSAGQSLLAGDGHAVETRAAPLPSATSPAASPTARPSAKPSKHRRATSASPSPRTRASSLPSPTVRPSSSPAPTPAPPARTRTSAGVERTWEGPPGLVSVRCNGSRTTLRSATPNNGYRVEADRGLERIEVHFESASREYQVVARCVAGVPRFDVEGGGEGHDE